MTGFNQIILASHNSHKIAEIKKILEDVPMDIISVKDLNWNLSPPEEGSTYYENALIKAKIVVENFGKPALGEDSGLEVDILGGKPGIYTARYAGEGASSEANNSKLLKILKDTPFHQRTARYRCTIVLLFPNGEIHNWEGLCEGIIALEPKGTAGFGYDPIFFLPEYGQTFAELGEEIKNKISHRAMALSHLKIFLQRILVDF